MKRWKIQQENWIPELDIPGNENPALLDDPELDESEKPEYPKPLLFILNQWLFKKEN